MLEDLRLQNYSLQFLLLSGTIQTLSIEVVQILLTICSVRMKYRQLLSSLNISQLSTAEQCIQFQLTTIYNE